MERKEKSKFIIAAEVFVASLIVLGFAGLAINAAETYLQSNNILPLVEPS